MPATDTLARRDSVELIRTGRWNISTGQWTATRDDLTAAVAAMSCPAIQKPIVKIGHTDKRFTPGDGEPAIGWYENLRTTDGGHTLVADQVAPAWMTDVQAAAWPNRSVEGSYNYRCGLGHTHPFVLTAVALLGVTPPGVSTLAGLNSLDDVRALYGVAAAARVPGQDEVRIAASVPGDALRAAAEQAEHTGAMVALIPTDADAQRLAVEGGEPADALHVTLMYLGQAADFTAKAQAAIVDAIRRATEGIPAVEADGFAVSAFNPPGSAQADGLDRDTCLVLGVGGADLADTRDIVAAIVPMVTARFSIDLPTQHRPWVPHVTLTYTDDLDQVKALAGRAGPVTFDRIRVAFAGGHTDIPLTAVGSGGISELDVPGPMLPIAAAGDGKLRDYWLRGEGAAKIRWGTGGDFTRCVRHLRKHVTDPEGLCAEYHHQATGMWPGDRRNVDASEESPVPNPQPTLTERIHHAWNASGQPEQQWIVEAAPDEVIVMDNTDRTTLRVPVTVAGDSISFGTPQRVRPTYVPADEPVAASRLVFASADESRPDVAAHGHHDQSAHGHRGGIGKAPGSGSRKTGGKDSDELPVGTRVRNRSHASWRGVVRPAPSGPKAGQSVRKDHGTTDLYVVWSDSKTGDQVAEGWFPRIGMEPLKVAAGSASTDPGEVEEAAEDAAPATDPGGGLASDDPNTSGEPTGTPPHVPPAAEPETNTDPKEDPVSTLSTDVRSRLGLPETADDAAVLAALDGVKAKADTAPNPQQVAAARDEMKTEITRLSGELADIRAGAAANAKKALFDGAVQAGRIKPADRPKWEERYDRAPEVTADILASLAPNTEVPVAASGYTGDVDQAGGEDGYDSLVAGIDGPFATTGGK